MKPLSTGEIGRFGETRAALYLLLHGYLIKARNYRSGKHEIDIIAESRKDIIFAEVKTRTCSSADLQGAPHPSDAVNSAKQRYTRTAARHYLNTHPTKKQPRMDVIEIYLIKKENRRRPRILEIRHIKAAY